MIPKIASLKDLQLLEDTLSGILGFQIQAMIFDQNIISRRILEAIFKPGPLLPGQVFTKGVDLLKAIEPGHLPMVVFYDLEDKDLTLEVFLASLKKMRTTTSNKIWVLATVQMMDKERLVKLAPLGLSGVLTKPLNPDAVRSKLKELCNFPSTMELGEIKETIDVWNKL
jgi:CheY-like chemotaxis protein